MSEPLGVSAAFFWGKYIIAIVEISAYLSQSIPVIPYLCRVDGTIPKL